jgi:hypothetical protein
MTRNKGNSRLQPGYTPSESRAGKGSRKAQRNPNPVRQRLFDLKMAAEYLGRPPYSVRTLIWGGTLPYIQDGRKIYLDVYDLDSYIERSKERMI